ncbi:Flp family type IVb pilin, partial [Mesorhizobium sp. M7A.F.Ca.MR.228.00.0.0]
MKAVLLRFLNDETGATAVEYGLIVAVLSLAI